MPTSVSSFEREIASFKKAAVRKAAENLLQQTSIRVRKERRVFAVRRVSVLEANSSDKSKNNNHSDNSSSSSTGTGSPRTTTWMTPHGKASIVSDFLKPDAVVTDSSSEEDEPSANKNRAKRRRSSSCSVQVPVHTVPHDLTEIQMLSKKPRLDTEPTAKPEDPPKPPTGSAPKPPPAPRGMIPISEEEMERDRQRVIKMQQAVTVLQPDSQRATFNKQEPAPKQVEAQPPQAAQPATVPVPHRPSAPPVVTVAPPPKPTVVAAPATVIPPPTTKQQPTPEDPFHNKKPENKPTMSKAKPVVQKIIAPPPPNVYPNQTHPPHIDPNLKLTKDELRDAWTEHYRRKHQKKQAEETAAANAPSANHSTSNSVSVSSAKEPIAATKAPAMVPAAAPNTKQPPRVLQEHNHQNKAATSTTIATKPRSLRKLPKAVTAKPLPQKEEPQEQDEQQQQKPQQPQPAAAPEVVEILDDDDPPCSSSPEGKQAAATHQHQQQQEHHHPQAHARDAESQRRQDQEIRRLRRIEVEALEKYGVSTTTELEGTNTHTTRVSEQFHTFLCWFKQNVLSGQWVMENKVAPTHGWQTYVSRSVLILHLRRLPKSYLLGATMYQRPSTREWQQLQQQHPEHYPASANPPYHVSCHALMEITREPILGKVLRKWTNWGNHVPTEYRGTIFTYMIQKLIHTRRKGVLYQFPSGSHVEHLLSHGPVNGRDLEVVTVVLEETPTWLV